MAIVRVNNIYGFSCSDMAKAMVLERYKFEVVDHIVGDPIIRTPFGDLRISKYAVSEEPDEDPASLKNQLVWAETNTFNVGDIVRLSGHMSHNDWLYGRPLVVTEVLGIATRVRLCGSHDKYAWFSDVALEKIPVELYNTCKVCGQVIENFNPDTVTWLYAETSDMDTPHVVGVIDNDCKDSDEVFYCGHCERWFARNDTVYYEIAGSDEDLVCAECRYSGDYAICDDCGWLFDIADLRTDESTCLCNDCFSENGYVYCSDCGAIIGGEDIHEYRGNCYCESCLPEVEEYDTGRVMNYSFKPDEPNFLSCIGENTPMYMGVELEIDKGNNVYDCAEDLGGISQECQLFYLKHDGSLNNGIEIVTQPATFKYHMEKFPWENISSIAREYGFKSHDADTCGLHVHISREAFGVNQDVQDLNIAKVLVLFDKFWDTLVTFSRRNASQMRWCNKPESDIGKDDDENTAIYKKNTYERSKSRYHAVNLQNLDTVEFRLFRGSLKVNTIRATLQFLNNLVAYVIATPLADVQDARFKDIIDVQHYDELDAYLADRNIG